MKKDISGENLIALAGTVSIKISEDMDIEEIVSFIELLGLLKHNLEVIKCRRLIKKIDKKEDDKKEKKTD